jgi:DNA-binding LytR/AlgR family response regulator
MKKLSILVVEDNSFISEDIVHYIQESGHEVSGQAFDYEEAIELIDKKKPDIVLLDVDLNGPKSGIDIAHHIKQTISRPFLFITSFSDSATLQKIHQTGPYGYILKPFEEKTLQANIELAWHKFNAEHHQLLSQKLAETIFVKVKQALLKIEIKDILYAEAFDNYCYIKTHQQKHLVSQTLKSVEQKLLSHGFMRIHRGYLINIAQIQSVIDHDIMIGNELLPIGRSFKDELMGLLHTL